MLKPALLLSSLLLLAEPSLAQADAAPSAKVSAAFGNTLLTIDPDGRSRKIWLQPDGTWTGLSRRGLGLAGKWHEKIGAQGRVSFGSAELLEDVWGVKPGAVTPFGAINDQAGRVRVVLDEAMMRCERLNFHPLVNTRTTGLRSADLVKFLRATGHEPMIVALGQDGRPVE